MILRRVEAGAALVHNAAPVRFGPARYFFGEEIETVDVPAIQAIKFLEYIEVGEFLAIDFDIIAPFHILESIEREANAMVDFEYDVE